MSHIQDKKCKNLIPQDAKSGDPSTYILPMQQVESALTNLDCRHCLIILDCFFAGAFRWSSTRKAVYVPEKIYQERYDRFIKDPVLLEHFAEMK